MMVNLANDFSGRGYAVDLVVADRSGIFQREVGAAVEIIDLRSSRVLLAVPALARHLRLRRPRALLSAGTNVNVAALWARRLAGVATTVVVSERNHLSTASRHAALLRKRLLMPLLVRGFYRWADSIVGISEGVVEDLSQVAGLPRERMRVIYNPVVTPEILADRGRHVDHRWFAPGAPPVVVAAGRLVPQKDHPTLIRAFARLRARRPAHLVLLGEGTERPRLEALIYELGVGDDVELLGFVERPVDYMRRSDVFVFSSAWEGFGNVIVEALATGCPVVSTDCPSGPAEILDGGRYGMLVPVGDASALADAILTTLDAPPDPNFLKARAAEFSVEGIADQYLKALLG